MPRNSPFIKFHSINQFEWNPASGWDHYWFTRLKCFNLALWAAGRNEKCPELVISPLVPPLSSPLGVWVDQPYAGIRTF
jgi:hypothetical protein